MMRKTTGKVPWWEMRPQDFRDRYENDLVRFGREVLDFMPWSLQEQVIRSVVDNPITVVPAGQGVGKTYLAAPLTIRFLMNRPHSVVVTTAPTGPQVKLLLWSYIESLMNRHVKPHDDANMYEVLQSVIRVSVSEEWFAVGLSPREDVNFQGFHREHMLVILDEAPGVRREIFEAAQSLMTTDGSRMLLVGNPTRTSGFFYDACTGKVPGTNVIRMACLDSPNLTDEYDELPRHVTSKLVSRAWVDARRDEWGEDSPLWQARVLGEFPGSSVSSVIPREWVLQATARPDRISERPRYPGVDVARHGDDKTVYVSRIGNRVEVVDIDMKQSTMHVAGKTATLCTRPKIDVCCIDAAGLGWGPYDRLIERQDEEDGFLEKCDIVAVDVGKASNDPEKFPNLRSEIWFNTRDALDPEEGLGLSIQDHESLKEDLSSPEFGYDSKNRRVVEKKDAMKKRLGRSPDFADAVNVALWCDTYGYLGDMWSSSDGASAQAGARRPRIPTIWGRIRPGEW